MKLCGICISEKRGTEKKEVSQAAFVEGYGIRGDAHAGNWHRQVSLLSCEKIEEFRRQGADVAFGAFGENLIVEGADLRTLAVGSRFYFDEVILELTQIGKECHNHCEIYQRMGDCIMPREGVFAEVVRGGTMRVGETFRVEPPQADRPYQAAVVTLSDKGAAGEREDKSGALLTDCLEKAGYAVRERLLLPDGRQPLEKELIRLSDGRQMDVVFTTGGTGFSSRDFTPEATIAVCDRMAPGIAEAIRAYSMTITDRAMFSRAVSGIRGNTLIINLPGSPKAVQESLDFLLPRLSHGLDILRGNARECARPLEN
ncbi:MAG: molybdopterin-binding protein [Lachnospiraceae bacterium]|nr:molybdopterin-binding protein [Lachnospiraceae bacterium]